MHLVHFCQDLARCRISNPVVNELTDWLMTKTHSILEKRCAFCVRMCHLIFARLKKHADLFFGRKTSEEAM